MEAVKGGTCYKQPEIERAVISRFKIYEVADMELDELRDGYDGGKKFNLSISCLSLCIGMVSSFFTSTFDSDMKAGAMYMLSAVLFVLGIALYISYRKSKSKTDEIYERIKSRGKNPAQ